MEERTQSKIIAPYGGYCNLKSYQMAEVIHDAVMVFCDRFIAPVRALMTAGAAEGQAHSLAKGDLPPVALRPVYPPCLPRDIAFWR